MADRFRILTNAPTIRFRFVGVAGGFLVMFFGALRGVAQTPEAASYPVDPVAAAGMTSGLPNGVTYRSAEMMQVRTSAQNAQGEASAASMARSVDQTIEERNRDLALQNARTNKAIKEDMRNRLKFDRAAAVQQKVSAHDMSTWQQNGGVRVERNVPDAFLTSLIEEEELAAARAAESGEKKRFSLFGGDDEPSDEGALSFLGSIKPPKLPFIGGGNEDEAAAAPPSSDNSEPVFAQTSSSRGASPAPAAAPAPAQAAPSKPGRVPMISGAALVDGRSPVTTSAGASADRPPASDQSVSFADATPEPEHKKPGLFSMFNSEPKEDSFVPSSQEESSGGFFGFGKKKVSHSGPSIDAGLFPEGSVDQKPRGGSLSGGATVADVAEDVASAPSSTGSIVMPGQEVEKSRGFSLPKPNLSLPSIPSITKSEGSRGGGGASTGYHVVTSTAQFMVYGAEQMQSEIRALPAGTSVMVTKPGETWSGIRLDDGTEGVVQNKNLKPASGGGGGSGGEFVTSPGQ